MSTRLAYSPADVLAADHAPHRSYAQRVVEAVEYIGQGHLRSGFTAEDVREFIEVNHPEARAHSVNVIGAAMKALAEAGRIRTVGVDTATRPEARGRLLRVWRYIPKPPAGRGNTPAPPGRA